MGSLLAVKCLFRSGIIVALIFVVTCTKVHAQQTARDEIQQTGSVPILRVNVVERTAKAINYRHRSGSTSIDFRGTGLAPESYGEAKVESKKGYIEIEVEFDDLPPASKFGPEYLTYVLWAISPEGRATNLGEILLDDTRDGKLNVTTELQAFGLLVTAEPYFAVTQPSDVVVMENVVRKDTVGKIEEIDAKYELLQRGVYTLNADATNTQTRASDNIVPLELQEARNAVQIARSAGADRYASDTFKRAESLLRQAEDYKAQKQNNKSIAMVARESVQTAEDARLITVKRMEEERIAKERADAAEREARAKAQAEQEATQRAQAEADRLAAERARLEAERARQEAEAAKAATAVETERAKLQAQEADRLRQQAEQDKAALRARLTEQLNRVLETRDSARGLIVNMSDVLFDTGRYTLRSAAREKLAKIAGIVLANPRLKLQIEGHTDNVGSDEFNQGLSEKRAQAVRDYLTQQGISTESTVAQGFGETQPIASNETADGRQQNRRVELVVSGESIGSAPSELR
jgi:outer membrane protein OmpA-like peptidoglycan-associated protein